MTDLVDRFVLAYRGRGDAYGDARGFCRNEPLTREVFERHLTSPDPADHIGVYPMLGEQCSFGAVDLDGKDFGGVDDPEAWRTMLNIARNLQTVLKVRGVPSHIERARSGFHLWVHPEEPLVECAVMRRALLAACAAISFNPKEVFPKAEGPRPGTRGLGNFIRATYGGHLAPTKAASTTSGPRQELDPRESGLAGGFVGGRGVVLYSEDQEQASEVLYCSTDDGQGCGGESPRVRRCGWCRSLWREDEALPRQELEGHLGLASTGPGGGGGADRCHPPLDGGAPHPGDPRWPQRVLCDYVEDRLVPLCLACALGRIEAGKAPTAALASIAELWVPPAPKTPVDFNRLAGLEAEPLLARIAPAQRGLARTIWRDGPPEGGDRSTALAKLAHLCVEGGLTAAETYVVVDSADQRCGKFVGRDDRELRLEEIVANAY